MRKRFTKIICAAVAAISALGIVAASGCSKEYKWNAVSDKDTSSVVAGTNGGFLVQTGDYVYFINGKASYLDDNTFGSAVRGSVQRIKKSDFESKNYSSTQTIVPSVLYSGQYNAGLYIYGNYVYYTTPSTQKDSSGNILNSRLDFRRTTLDGGNTPKDAIWQSTDNNIDYRFVEAGGKVYILYAIAENLYGTTATNVHSINVETGENKILAYNVGSYVFDTEDATNPAVYYTMSVPYFTGGADTFNYNQIYRVTADVATSPREYDFSDVDGYNASSNPVYINYGDFVLDGIGTTENQTEGRVTQFNYAYWHSDNDYELINSDYNYSLNSYKNGVLSFTRKESVGSTSGVEYAIDESVILGSDGHVSPEWDAVTANNVLNERFKVLFLTDTTKYLYWNNEADGKTYAISSGGSGISKGVLENGIVDEKQSYLISEDGSAEMLFIREEDSSVGKHTYLYYSVTGGNGNNFYRIAIDGEKSDYVDLPWEVDWDDTWTYRGVKILDLDACSVQTGWYSPEFVGNTLVFASETYGMSSYNYIMACDLGKDGKMLSNKEIHELNEKYEKVTEKIEEYDDETNTDGTAAYANLSNALKYLWYTGDVNYLDSLINAYVNVQHKDVEYLYSVRSAEIYREYAEAKGDWESYKEDSKTVNGQTVYANSRNYYYSVLGKMSSEHENGLKDYYKKQYMQEFPVDNSTWWEKLSTGAKAGFIIGMVAAGLVVLCGLSVGAYLLIRWIMKKKSRPVSERRMKVDITDDKDMDVYGETVE